MKLRRTVQIVFLALFFYLLIATTYPLSSWLPLKLFLQMDPLTGLSAALASRDVSLIWFAIPTIIATLIVGRFFCGWICPLGTLIDISDRTITPKARFKSEPGTGRPGGTDKKKLFHPRTKCILLVVFLAAAVFGVQWLWFLDPIPLLTRVVTTSLLPYFEFSVRAVFEALYRVPGIRNLSEPVYFFLKDSVLSFEQPFFLTHQFAGLIALGIILLSIIGRRTWCRNLCPLGGLLGLVGRISPIRLNRLDSCTHCRKCGQVCKMGAIASDTEADEKTYTPAVDRGECILCGTCWNICPVDALKPECKERKNNRPKQADLTRRHVLGSVLGGLAAVPFLTLASRGEDDGNARVIRPPGARDEKEFLEKCIRCGECMKVCPTNAIHPTLLESGLNGLFSARLVPRIGYCEYECNLCGRICPTGAIENLHLSEKKRLSMGLAHFVKDRCLPHAQRIDCLVCEEHCPTPDKSIHFKRTSVTVPSTGEIDEILEPYVIPERCIGCGTCENVCPLEGSPGIRVYPHAKQKPVESDSVDLPAAHSDPY